MIRALANNSDFKFNQSVDMAIYPRDPTFSPSAMTSNLRKNKNDNTHNKKQSNVHLPGIFN